jgi:hypothetical protein
MFLLGAGMQLFVWIFLLTSVCCCKLGWAIETLPIADKHPSAQKYEPTSAYEVQTIEGWKVQVNRGLIQNYPDLYQRAVRRLENDLIEVSRRIPAAAVSKLKSVTIWLEYNEPHHPCAVYHPEVQWLRENDMNPEKARCVEISNAERYLNWTREQPMMVLHELAHAYHNQFLEEGFENVEVATAFTNAKSQKLYDKVLRNNHKIERAYAMTNPMEYFAEASEAYFGTNDFFPFVAAELRNHDTTMYRVLEAAWGSNK